MNIRINDRWRVIDGELQWLLQYRAGVKVSHRPDGSVRVPWRSQYFFATRHSLTRVIGEMCGEVDPAAIAAIEALPEKHPQPYLRERRAQA